MSRKLTFSARVAALTMALFAISVGHPGGSSATSGHGNAPLATPMMLFGR